MQQTKRRSRKGVILLALAIALLVVAIVPAAAMASAPNQLTPSLYLANGVVAQEDVTWYGGSATPTAGNYYPALNGVHQPSWTGINLPPTSTNVDVTAVNYIVDSETAQSVSVSGAAPQYVTFGVGYAEGMHTITSWLTATPTANTVYEKPAVTTSFGVDLAPPEWQDVTIDSTVYWNADVKFSASATDQYGSGVAPTPIASWTGGSATGTQLASDKYTYEVTGTVSAPTTETVSTNTVNLYATDYVGHTTSRDYAVKFDTAAPTTTYTITPAGADEQSGWTNTAVKVSFIAADQTPGAGVDYTEYVTQTTTGTAAPAFPAKSDSGTKGTSVTINTTAPVGPTYVYYRSVDKAQPSGNKENWNLVMVYYDDVAPTLSDDTPSWWINSSNRKGAATITITADDDNSGIATPGVSWAMETLSGTGTGPFVHVPLPFLGMDDGIHALTYSATDKAGNTASGSASVKLDSRAPVTDGDSGWVNGLEPYVLTATDQTPGSGVAATVYRVDQATPWSVNVAGTVAPTLDTSITLTGTQGATHTIDFASVDAALPWDYVASTTIPSYYFGNWELDVLNLLSTGSVYKSRSVKLDVTAPVVTIAGNDDIWHSSPVTLQFAATDVGAGVDYIESSTDGGATWTKGDSTAISANGVTTVIARAVDNVGIVSDTQSVTVKVSTTKPTVTANSATVKSGKRATIGFNVTAVTPTAKVVVQIRTKTGKTLAQYNYTTVTTNADRSVKPLIKLKKGTYLIRVYATDAAGNASAKYGTAKLTVK